MSYDAFIDTKPHHESLRIARTRAKLNRNEAAQACGLHRTNYTRQEKGQSRVNLACYRLLLIMGGRLPAPFNGWSINHSALWSPEGVSYSPGEIRALPYLHALIAEQYSELEYPRRHRYDYLDPITRFNRVRLAKLNQDPQEDLFCNCLEFG